MKKEVLISFVVMLFVFVSLGVSALNANDYFFSSNFSCSDYGLECGQAQIYNFTDSYNPYNTPSDAIPASLYNPGNAQLKSCGLCDNGNRCYYGKCVSPSVVGKCSRPSGFDENCISLDIPKTYSSSDTDKSLFCSFYGCSYNFKVGRCTGVINSCSFFMKQDCEELYNGTFDNSSGSCNSLLLSQSPDYDFTGSDFFDKWCFYQTKTNSISGCQPENIAEFNSQHEPVMHVLYKGTFSSDEEVYLEQSDFRKIEAGESVPLTMKIFNSGLPENTPISFTIYARSEGANIPLRTWEHAIQGKIDNNGSASADWFVTKNDMMYKNTTTDIASFSIYLVVNGTLTTEFAQISINQKEGSCLGGVSCNNIQNKVDCQIQSCSWRAYNVWDRLIDTIKSWFGL